MPKNNKGYKVGDRIQISLNGRICDGTIKAVIESTSGVRLTVSFGRDQVASEARGSAAKPAVTAPL